MASQHRASRRAQNSNWRRLTAAVVAVCLVALGVGFATSAQAVGGWTSTLSSVGTQPVPSGDALEYSYQVQCSVPTGCGTITAHIPPPPGWTAAAGAPTVNIPSGVTGVTYTANADGSLNISWVNPPPGQSNQVQLNWPTTDYTTAPGTQPITATVTDGTTTQTPLVGLAGTVPGFYFGSVGTGSGGTPSGGTGGSGGSGSPIGT